MSYGLRISYANVATTMSSAGLMGQTPPDFLIGGSIAIEVRRLNQNHVSAGGIKGLEEASRKFIDSIRKIALSLGPPTRGKSWYVSADFRRPIGDSKSLRRQIRTKLQDFIAAVHHEKITYNISNTVSIEITPSGILRETFFVIGGLNDRDTGGWLIPEMTKNIGLCIDEKSRKIARFQHKYPHWWLILVDYISPSLDEDDRNQIRDHLTPIAKWDKIIILNRGHSNRSFTI